MIKLININKIYPHPDNPRKDVGDVTELAGSIKASGILQNLTVVPKNETEYTVIIGHRRLAAARKAGLAEVPCAVVEMDYREQLATMLAENMQRSDLTVYEQAQGIQMMFDFGESVDGVAEKTGLSTSTVRRRARLMKYDADKVQTAFKRGATVMDFEELEKVKSPELRQEVLEYIGTVNFKWKLDGALAKEKRDEYFDSVEKQLKEFAQAAEDTDSLCFIKSYRGYDDEVMEKPSDGRKYYYSRSEYSVSVYAEPGDEEKNAAAETETKRQEKEERIAELKRIAGQAYESRKNFIRTVQGLSKFRDEVISFAIWGLTVSGYSPATEEGFTEIYGSEGLEKAKSGIFDMLPEKALLITAYCRLRDSESNGYSFYQSVTYRKNPELDELYNFLKKLGYEMSDEEKAWKDGTLEAYERDDK